MKRRLTALLAAATWSGACICTLAALPAHAGLFDDDEARNRIETLRHDVADHGKRLDAIATNSANTTRSQLELANQIEQIKADLAKLRGQSEVLTYELDAAQKRQKDFYVDLDNRLRKLESSGVAVETKPAAASEGATPPQRDPAAEMRDYESALTLFKNAKYRDALAAFQGFIKTYGNSGLLPSAHYWTASAHYQLHEFQKAADLFGNLPATWPADAKAPDALLGQANSLRDMGDLKGARKVLQQLVEKYPTSSAAQGAKLRLQKK